MDNTRFQILMQTVQIVAQITNTTVDDIRMNIQTKDVCDARQMFLVYMAAQQDVQYSLAEIAAFVNLSHAMVIYSKTQVQNKRDTEKPFDQKYKDICKSISESAEINKLIAVYKSTNSKHEMTIPEVSEAIELIKMRIQQLSDWLGRYISNPYRSEIQKDKRKLEIELQSKEVLLATLNEKSKP